MADLTVSDLQSLLAPYGSIGDAIAMYAQRPQKTSVTTTTNTTSVPLAVADMIASRNKIGEASDKLEQILKERENPWYATLKALGQVQGSSEPGKWLESGLRGLATGGTILNDIKSANAAQMYEKRLKDLETILKYDKEMGSAQNQTQNQVIGYQEMPYGGAGGKGKQSAAADPNRKASNLEKTATNLADIYKTIEDNPTAFSSIGGIKQDEASRALREGVETAGIKDMQQREFEYLGSIMPNGYATALNSAKEQEIMAPYTTAFRTGTGSSKKAQIKNMLGQLYDDYKVDVESQGFKMPISKEEYIRSRLAAGRAYNPEFYIKSDAPMYKDGAKTQQQQVREAADITQRNWNKLYEGLK